MVMKAWKQSAQKYQLPIVVENGHPCLPVFRFDHKLKGELKTLYTQLMLGRGFLAGLSFSPTLAHTEAVVSLFSAALDDVFREMAWALNAGDVRERLKGPVAHDGFRRLL